MFLSPGPLALPPHQSPANLPSTHHFPYPYRLLSVSPLSFSELPLCFLPTSCLPCLLSLSLILLSLPPYGFLLPVSLLPSFLSLISLTSYPQPQAYFPLHSNAQSGEEKGKGSRDPLDGKPWSSDNGLNHSPCPPAYGSYSV